VLPRRYGSLHIPPSSFTLLVLRHHGSSSSFQSNTIDVHTRTYSNNCILLKFYFNEASMYVNFKGIELENYKEIEWKLKQT